MGRSKCSWALATCLLLVWSIFQLSACSAGDSELERNRRLWRGREIANYNLVLARHAGGTWSWVPVRVKVRDNKATSIDPIRERLQLERLEGYEDFDTFEKCFDRIQEKQKKGDTVTVTYNKEFGYPESIKVFPKGGGMDSELFLEIRELEIITN